MFVFTFNLFTFADTAVEFSNTQYYGREGDALVVCVVLSAVPFGGSEVDIVVTITANDSSAGTLKNKVTSKLLHST